MRDYELVIIVSPEAGEEGFPAVVERITAFITGQGCTIKNVDRWGRRRLAYPIKRNLEGYYAVIQFSGEPQSIRPLEANLDLAEDILRHLVIKVEEEILPAPAEAHSPPTTAAAEPDAGGETSPEPTAEPVAAAAASDEE